MKKGFTLSEILITLGIVGIVAVLTVPSVMRNYRNRLYVAQLQKTYSQITNAVEAIMHEENVDNYYETTAGAASSCNTSGVCTKGIGYFLQNHFKLAKKNCSSGTKPCTGGSSNSSYKLINGGNISGGIPASAICVQTVNGAAICGFHNSTNSVTSLVIDVNGPGEPNIAGRDVFSADIKRDGSLSDYGSGSNDPSIAGATAASCSTSSTSIYIAAAGCLTSIIEAGWKMEY